MTPNERLARLAMSSPSSVFVHRLALCESDEVGAGTQIWAFAHVMKGAVIGRDCNIGDHAFIETGARIGDRVTLKNQAMVWDGVEIGDDVFVGPGVSFTNDVFPRSRRQPLRQVDSDYRAKAGWLVPTRVGKGATLGARCVILPGAHIGAYAMVAAGAVVTRDVPPHALVAGVSANRMGWVCRCGARLVEEQATIWRCRRCGETYDPRKLGRVQIPNGPAADR
jgi:UDP-2-acetamido-3-amino-2,3-dideoxy-glucuronate N-acetyltransferase